MALVTYRNKAGEIAEDQVLAGALGRAGLRVATPIWDDPTVDWARFRMAVVRSTWDYFHRRPQYLRWIRRTSARVDLWNRPGTLRWNTDKHYLADLEAAGIPTVPTTWVRRRQRFDLAHLLEGTGWDEFVVKPTVSAAGEETFRFHRRSARAAQREIDRLAGRGAVMVQPYLDSVATTGERSLMFLGGRYSHAVRRTPLFPRRKRRAKERLAPAPEALRQLGRRVLEACPEETLYARVDLVRDGDGTWRLLELEVTEPSLFFVPYPRGAVTLAAEVLRRLSR